MNSVMKILDSWREMTSPMTKFLVIIAGPTASGKTETGIRLAEHFDSEIISADSRQIYKETLIGTAVPTPEQLQHVTHHFIQTVSLSTYYNASMYEQDVLKKLDELFASHDIVFLVGGSGLYINAVCEGIDDLPTIKPEIRNELAEKFRTQGIGSLQEMLRERDPVSYEKIDLNNHYRVLKALEVSIQTGKPYSSFLTHQEKKRPFRMIRIALDLDRTELYNRINTRVDEMMAEGWVDEVRGLEKFRHVNAMKTVGYRELFRYLDGEINLEEATDLIRRNTRKYARKQLTWFRKNNLYTWFNPSETDRMIAFIESTVESENKNT